MVEVSGLSTTAHQLFVNWLNGLLENYSSGVYDSFVQRIVSNFSVQKTNLLFQELYLPNGKEFYGYFVVTNFDSNELKLYFFNSSGNFLYYNFTEINNLLVITSENLVSEFFPEIAISLYNSEQILSEYTLTIYFETLFGIKFPVFYLRKLDGLVIAKGIMDVIYNTRKSSSYNVYIDPDGIINKYLVKNLSTLKIKLEIPIFENFTIPYEIKSESYAYVPVTPYSTSFLETAVKYSKISYNII
jgi:hypothetical protein